MGQVGRLLSMVRGIIAGTFLMFVSVAAFTADPSMSNAHALNGLQFKGKTGEKGKRDHHSDTIIFENGQFRSLDCENWDFGAAPYSVSREGKSYVFKSVLRSSERGTLEWQGTMIDDKATTTFNWLHERWYWNIDRHYWFEGTRQE